MSNGGPGRCGDPAAGLSPGFPGWGDRMSIDQLHELSQIADEPWASADELAWRQVAVCRKFPGQLAQEAGP